ncbi:MAG TPA: aspartate 1-decarboxylase [Bacillota bacterium]
MLRQLCKSKIHRATVTGTNLNYAGSITIDAELLQAAKILEYELVQVVNINNGQRFETYAIAGEPGSGTVCLNGAAARLAEPGDLIIILSYGIVTESEGANWRPVIVHVDDANRLIDQE